VSTLTTTELPSTPTAFPFSTTDNIPPTPPYQGFNFTLQAQQGQARAGLFQTPHGLVETPVFMPVGTNSTVKSLTWQQVASTQAQIVLSNSYHLYLRPGHKLVEKAGGLHHWMNWHKPILTDSGGFQVFSLAKFRKITEAGVHFRDTISGNKHFIGPEESMAIQNSLGPDVMMAFDECPPYPATYDYALHSLERTQRWLERCFKAHARPHDQALFPIVQGSTYQDLRTKAVKLVTEFDAVGYAIGGVSVGEPRPMIHQMTRYTAPLLPSNKPRYLMGVGTLEDLLQGIRSGVDMFDCVLPNRNGRHGTFLTPTGNRNIKNAEFREDFSPLVEGCDCYTCHHHSKAYLRHLFHTKEDAGKTLISLHNIRMLVRIGEEARAAILAGTFDDFYAERMTALGYADTIEAHTQEEGS
jgi:queuine tRNA-ribosyltransferase